MQHFREIVELFPEAELAERLGITVHAVRQMRQRDSIAAEHWPAMAEPPPPAPTAPPPPFRARRHLRMALRWVM